MNWWGLEDLRAEIREATSNCRVKSGYDDRFEAPIDSVPDAGASEGFPNAMEPVHDAYADSPPRNGGVGARVGPKGKANGAAGPSPLRRNDSAKSDATVKAKKTSEERAFTSTSRTSSMSSNEYEVSINSNSS